MANNRSGLWRTVGDHFEPDDAIGPKAQRQLRGQLEEIDYTAYAANRTVMGGTLSRIDVKKFERLGLACAQARARWVATALATTDANPAPTAAQIDELARLRAAYDELSQAYDGLRRMVERGYLSYGPAKG